MFESVAVVVLGGFLVSWSTGLRHGYGLNFGGPH